MLADDLQYACTVQVEAILLAAGYSGGQIYFEWSDDGGRSKQTFADATTRKRIAAGDDEQPAIEILPDSHIHVSLTYDDEVLSYASQDWGETWTYLDSLP